MQELNRLDQLAQLAVRRSDYQPDTGSISPTRASPSADSTAAGSTLYRLRTGDFRFYFEAHEDTVHVRYILHKNSLEDFLLRNKLPVSEQQLVEQHSKFWKYLDSLTP